VLNRNGRDYPDLKADGIIGSLTVQALSSFLSKRGQDGRKVILGMVAALQSAFLIELAEHRPKDE
jgi:energy-converting hydrogenase Eha subunit B